MKKNFFKKLSFVLALAMIVSVFAPAAGAFAAAKKPALNKSKVYLNLGVDGKDEFDFNVKNKSGYNNVDYVSADEDVAVVDEMGVTTATGIGRTTISVTLSNKKGVEYGTLKATVVVRDNVADLTAVTGLPADKAVVGEEYDLDVTYKTDAGNTEGSSSYFAWEVLKDGKATEAATIDKDGKFVATEAGKYEVVARAFQTIDGFKLFDADREKNAKYVLDTVKADVEVAVSILGVKLVTPKQFEITFDSSVKDAVKAVADVKLTLNLNETVKTPVPVWSFDGISEDGKVVTVSTYDNLVDKQTYTVTAAGATAPLYVQIGKPVKILMSNQVIPAGTASEVKYQLLDAYDVDVKSIYGGSVIKSSTVAFDGNGKLTLGNNAVAFVEYSYLIVNDDATVTTLKTDRVTVTGVAATVGSALEWTIDSSDFSKSNTSIKSNEQGKVIYGRIKKSDATFDTAGYKFESLTPSFLLIDQNTNTLIPVAAGTALVRVTNTNNTSFVSYIYVEVKAAPAASYIKASTPAVKLSNNIAGSVDGVESTTVTIAQVDQYGVETAVGSIQDRYFVAANKDTSEFVTVSATGNAITFKAIAGKSGTVNYYVKAADKTVTFSVTVLTPGTLNTYVVETSADSADAYVANADTSSSLNIKVYGVDANGIKKEEVKDLTSSSGVAVTYTVTNPDGAVVAGHDKVTFTGAATFAVDDTGATGVNTKAGTYTITVSIGKVNYTKTFTVANSRPAPSKADKALSVEATLATAVKDAVLGLIEVKLGDHKVVTGEVSSVEFITTDSSIVDTNATNFKAAGTVRILIQKIKFTYGGFNYEVPVNALYTVVVK